MHSKKLFIFTCFIISLFLTFLTSGCSDLSGGESFSQGIKITVISTDSSISFARTIMPESVSADKLTYVIAYRSVSDNEKSFSIEKEIKVVATGSEGYFYKDFGSGIYIIFLYAFNEENIEHAKNAGYEISKMGISQLKTYAGFSGNATIDTSNSAQNSIFLTANKYTGAAAGYAKVTISNSNDWKIPAGYAVYAGIYKENSYDDESRVYPSNGVDYSLFSSSSSDLSFETKTFSVSLPSGIYSFVIKYVSDKATYIYEEKLIVYANLTSSKTLVLPEIINKKPNAPSCLIAGYIEPETDSKGMESGYYKIQLAWHDNSLIETGFKIQILDVSNGNEISAPQTDTEYEALENSNESSEIYTSTSSSSFSQIINATAGLNATTATFSLPLGKRFVTRICAVNDSGDSEWTYISKNGKQSYTNPDDVSQTSTLDSSYKPFAADCETINLYRINYYYQGGEITALKNGTVQISPCQIQYGSQHSASSKVAILNPDGITQNAYITDNGTEINETILTLTNKTSFWNCWLKNEDSKSKKVSQSENYIQADSYVSGIKYYSDSKGTEANIQPTKDNFSSGTYYVRKVTISPYKGYENVSFIASYN